MVTDSQAAIGSDSAISSTTPAGATITTAYAGRNVRVFAVLESELHTLSFFNALATTFFSIASGLASIAIGISVTAAFTEKPTPAGEVLTKLGVPALLFMALVSVVAAGWAVMRKRSTLKTIREESTSKSV